MKHARDYYLCKSMNTLDYIGSIVLRFDKLQ